MADVTLSVNHEVGLHARPASIFVQSARQFESEIKVTCGSRSADAKSILEVLALGAGQGALITIHAEGEDREQALKTLVDLIRSNFDECP